MMGFFAAWSTTELAPLHLLWQIVGPSCVFVRWARCEYWPGWIALAITLVSWFGLASSVKGSLGIRPRVHRRVARDARSELGRRSRSALEAAGRRVRWGRVLLPFRFGAAACSKVVKNIAVRRRRQAASRHRLDVYKHRDTKAGAPVLLQIHGGGWVISNKDQQGQPLMCHLAARGWVCVAINYRLSPKATWPDHIVDCKRALAWVREHIAEYGGDPDYVVVTGGSAGGHLSAMMGLTANDPAVPAGFRRRRHVGAGDDPVLRRVRLDRFGRPTSTTRA